MSTRRHTPGRPARAIGAAVILAAVISVISAISAGPGVARADAGPTAGLTAATGAPTVTGARTAIFNGQVQTGAMTSYAFQYGDAGSAWCQSGGTSGAPAATTIAQRLSARVSEALVSLPVAGLVPGDAYCDQLVATDRGGSGEGGTTEFTAGAPSAQTGAADTGSLGTATVRGSVDPSGQLTTVRVDYDTAGSPWCASSGASGTPTYATRSWILDARDDAGHEVSAELTGLHAGSGYCAAITATNASASDQGAPDTFTEGQAAVTTLDAVDTGQSTAEIDGTVDPGGRPSAYFAQYGPSGSRWCQSSGAHGVAPGRTPAQDLAVDDAVSHAVAVTISGLTAGSAYCAEVAARTPVGTVASGFVDSFVAGAPSAVTDDANAAGLTSAVVDGQVDPEGAATTYAVQYALAGSNWCTTGVGTPDATAAVALPSTAPGPVNVSIPIAGLSTGTAYCAALTATNASGTNGGAPVQFTTGSAPTAVALTAPTTITGAGTATLNGQVDTGGPAAGYQFDYAPNGSAWCASGGATGSPAQTPSQTATGTPTPVTADLTGLVAGNAYCDELVVTETGASPVDGSIVSFTAGLPDVQLDGSELTSPASATVQGDVDPSGQATTVAVDYDVSASAWCRSGGAAGTPAHQTAPEALNPQDATSHDISLAITGLAQRATYCAAITATNAAGTATSPAGPVAGGAPYVYAYQAIATGETTAEVDAFIDPYGEATTFVAEYDLASSTWCENGGAAGTPRFRSARQTIAAGESSDSTASIELSGLVPGSTYCVGVAAVDASGLTAPGYTLPLTVGAPVTSTNRASVTAASTATLQGVVDPTGQATVAFAQYALAGSAWCQSGGTLGRPLARSAPVSFAFVDDLFHPVTVDLTGLRDGARYCAAIAATNASGAAAVSPLALGAGEPTAVTADANATGLSSATVDGQVDPAGQATTYQARYGPVSSTWCVDDGSAGTPAGSTPAVALGADDSALHDVSVDLGGLSPGRGYCAEIVATNAGGAATSLPVTFTAGLPGVQIIDATTTGPTSATITGDVDPAGQATTYAVQYGGGGSTWCESGGAIGTPASSSAPQSLDATDTAYHPVAVTLSALAPDTTYCAAIVATAPSGTSTSTVTQFTASSLGTGVATTGDAYATSATAAIVDGSVDAYGQATTYAAEYGPASGSWCQSGGLLGAPAGSTAPVALGALDDAPHAVSVALSDLTAGTAYCAAVAATSASGTSLGAPITFTGGLPSADTDDTDITGASTATLNGTVNPAGQTTSYLARYDTSGSTWCQNATALGTPAGSTATIPLGADDGSPHAVAVPLSGLTPGTTYCATIVAVNGTGASSPTLFQFTTGTPEASTIDAYATGPGSATIDGQVQAGGQTTTYDAQYAPTSSEWCASGTLKGSPAMTTAPTPLGATDGAPHDVAIDLTGLTRGTTYCVQITATNPTATAVGGTADVTAGAPSADTGAVTDTGATTAVVSAMVDPAGQPTTYAAQYGPGSSLWCETAGGLGAAPSTTTAIALDASDGALHPVTVTLTELTAGASYCAQITATNATAVAEGGVTGFTAAPAGQTVTVSAGAASPVSPTSEALTGTVDPGGSDASYQFQYASAGADWCTSEGATGTPSTTAPQSAGAGTATETETATLTGLSPDTAYCWTLTATNATGTGSDPGTTFTTLADSRTG